MITFVKPYPATTKGERDRSVSYLEHLLREIRRKIQFVEDPQFTVLTPEFLPTLKAMRDQVSAEIERLRAIDFSKSGVSK